MVKKSNKKQNITATRQKKKKTGLRTGRPPKFNYDREDFYEAIHTLALQGFTDAGIAYQLHDMFGQKLNPSVFSRMKNGRYEGWTKAENERRSEKFSQVLASARAHVNSIVRGRYLKYALGGIKIHNKVVTTRQIDVEGSPVDVVQTTETENELPPNGQALCTWLFHHDPEWRSIQKGVEPEMVENGSYDAAQGIDIRRWIELETGLRKDNEK